MSKREQILAYIGTLLAVSPPAGIVPVRSRAVALSSADLPAETYYPQTDKVLPVHREGEGARAGTRPTAIVRRQLFVAIECIAKAGTGTTPDEELDVMAAHVTGALSGTGADWKSVGAISAAEVETEFSFDVLDAPVALATVVFRVDYITQAGDPEVL